MGVKIKNKLKDVVVFLSFHSIFVNIYPLLSFIFCGKKNLLSLEEAKKHKNLILQYSSIYFLSSH